MLTFAGVPRGGASNNIGVVEARNFHRLLLVMRSETLDGIYRIYILRTGYTALRRLFSGPQCVTLNELE